MTTTVAVNPPVEGWLQGAFLPVKSSSAAYTITGLDRIVVLTGSTGRTFTLPSAVGIAGRVYWVKNGASADVDLTLDGAGSETIDGAATFVLDQHESVAVVSDGANWLTLGRGGLNGTAG